MLYIIGSMQSYEKLDIGNITAILLYMKKIIDNFGNMSN
jgi:hypothetical protein